MNQPLLLRSTTDHESCCIASPVLTAAVNFPRLQLATIRTIVVLVPVRTPLTTNSSTGTTSETYISFAREGERDCGCFISTWHFLYRNVGR